MSDELIRKLDIALDVAEPPRPGIDKVKASIEALVEALREEGFSSAAMRRTEVAIAALPGACVPLVSLDEDLILDQTETGGGDTPLRREVIATLSGAILDFHLSDEGERFRRYAFGAGADIVRMAEKKMHERRKGVVEKKDV